MNSAGALDGPLLAKVLASRPVLRYYLLMNPPPKQLSGHKTAFTIVELLVTIAIIVVLAALSFVGFRRVMESARAATCVNNMKQVATNHVILAQENSGFIVHPWASAPQGSWQRNWSEFHTILLSEDFSWLQPAPDVNARMRTMDHFHCPTAYALRKSKMDERDNHRGWRTYGLNQKIGVNLDPDAGQREWTDGAQRLTEVASPAKLVLVSERNWDGSRYPGAIGPEPNSPGYANFHNGGFNVAYLDGHVERHTKDTFLLTGTTLPNGQVGEWSNPEFALMWRGRLTSRDSGD